MLFRLIEGDGKSIYLIGVEDNGYSKGIKLSELLNSLYQLIKITRIIKSTIKKLIFIMVNMDIATIRLVKNIDLEISLI